MKGKQKTNEGFLASKALDERLVLFIDGLKTLNPEGFSFSPEELLALLLQWDSSLTGKVNTRGIGRRIKALSLLTTKHTEFGKKYLFTP